MHPKVVKITLTLLCTVLLVPGLLWAHPVEDLYEYYQFRFSSGLPGNNWTISPDGQVGAAGPSQMAIPVAYTPSRGNFVLSANVGMSRGGLHLRWKGRDANGTFVPAFGIGRPGRGFYATYMLTGHKGEPAYNGQWQFMPEGENWPALAIGGIDVRDQRASTQYRPFDGDAQSFYLVGTKQVKTEKFPTYATVGVGTGRFQGIFAGLSTRIDDRFTLAAEYDTLGVNANMTYSLKDPDSRDNYTLMFGVADLRYMSYGLTYTKSR